MPARQRPSAAPARSHAFAGVDPGSPARPVCAVMARLISPTPEPQGSGARGGGYSVVQQSGDVSAYLGARCWHEGNAKTPRRLPRGTSSKRCRVHKLSHFSRGTLNVRSSSCSVRLALEERQISTRGGFPGISARSIRKDVGKEGSQPLRSARAAGWSGPWTPDVLLKRGGHWTAIQQGKAAKTLSLGQACPSALPRRHGVFPPRGS